MKYYIKSNGKTYGPIEENKIKDRVLSGFFSDASLVSADFKEWLPLQQCIPILRPTAAKSTIDEPPVENKSARMRLTADNVIHRGSIPKEKKILLSKKMTIVFSSAFVFLFLCVGGIYFLLPKVPPATKIDKTAPSDFQQVCRIYQSAVGVVTVTLEDSNGKLLSGIGDFKVSPDYPIGTAFAIDKNKFATNCHVAYGVKDQKNGVLENVLWRIIIKDAQQHGVKNENEFMQHCKKIEKEIENFRKYLHANVRVRSVEIRLAHTGGRSLPVTGIQIHPRYQTDPDKDFIFKNGEFDVAILTTGESVEKFFKTASSEKLYTLAPGQEIAYIGFPMEGLHDNGNLDLNRPEAIFKSGTINKITDFNNVFSTPEFNKSIIHDIPAAGGASGSPIFLPNGEVVAILWGVTHSGKNQQGRITSAIQHNMAVRIDSLDTVKKQRIHNLQDWLGEAKK